jgi:very-short-patch-repair endonuclease
VGIPRPADDPPEIILSERGRETTLDGVVVHRPRDRRDLSPVLRRNIRCSNILRLLCDLGAVDRPAVHAAVGHVLFAGMASPHALRTAINAHARFGRHGVPALREALDEWMIDDKPADSTLETAMDKLVLDFSLPPVEFHAIILGHEVDFWVIGTPIVLECDGWGTHGRDRRQFERDRARDAELTANGYITVRFTYRRLTDDPAWVAEKILKAVDRWR